MLGWERRYSRYAASEAVPRQSTAVRRKNVQMRTNISQFCWTTSAAVRRSGVVELG